MKTFFVAIQDQSSRSWAPVARVDKEANAFRLRYTNGARAVAGFSGFARMQELTSEFLSNDLFPLLKNRVLSRSRPEFAQFASWTGRSSEDLDYFEELSLTGGLRGTDSIEIFPMPDRAGNGNYEARFFVRGARYLEVTSSGSVRSLEVGDRLYLAPDPQNEYDSQALLLRTGEPVSLVGYVPRFYSSDFSAVLSSSPVETKVFVDKVNPGAPPPFRVLCKIEAPWPLSFEPCDSHLFKTIESNAVKTVA